jgi:hypothetical protein
VTLSDAQSLLLLQLFEGQVANPRKNSIDKLVTLGLAKATKAEGTYAITAEGRKAIKAAQAA